MNDFASYFDSILLKDFGYPQPCPARGQYWWNEFGYPSRILWVENGLATTLTLSGKRWEARVSEFHRFYYAPPLRIVANYLSKF